MPDQAQSGPVDLYLVRHAIAFDADPTQWPDDSLRPLTPDGARGGLGSLHFPSGRVRQVGVATTAAASLLARFANSVETAGYGAAFGL